GVLAAAVVEIVLVGEVVIDRRDVDVARRRDVADRDCREAHLREHARRDPDDLVLGHGGAAGTDLLGGRVAHGLLAVLVSALILLEVAGGGAGISRGREFRATRPRCGAAAAECSAPSTA